MITFIDEKTGVPFNVEPGHIFYFKDQQSIGLFYQQRIFFVSDKEELEVSIPENDIFFIYNVPNPIDGGNYNLEEIKTYNLNSDGKSIGDYYLHCINVGCYSNEVNEYTENIIIDGKSFRISADFYGQDEELEILLQNQGLVIPHDITRALYDTNVHEENTDWITLNRKYKELLVNIMDIYYQKGSYNSLMKSLDWFEYGDIIKLKEYWGTPDHSYLHENDITTIYTDAIKELMEMYTKTTFISIELPLNKEKEENGDIVYDTDDGVEKTIPIVEDILLDWSLEDIMLKLALLGYYFEKYFMPIHLDLLYSTVSRKIYSIIKTKTIYGNITRIDDAQNTNTFRVLDYRDIIKIGDYKGYQGIKDNIYYIQDCECFMSENSRIGLNNGYDGHNLSKSFIKQAASIPLKIKKIGEYVATKIAVSLDGFICEKVINDNIENDIIDDIIVYIKDPGSYKLGINLYIDDGAVLYKYIDVIVATPNYNHFNFFVMKRRNTDSIINDGKLTHYYHNHLAFPDENNIISIYEEDILDSLKYTDIYYPESVCNFIAGCQTTENLVLYNSKGESISTGSFEEIEIPEGWVKFKKDLEEIETPEGGIKKDSVYFIVNVNGKDEIYYLRSENDPEPKNRTTRKNKDNYFVDRRFISALWEIDNNANMTGLPQDTIFMCVPEYKYNNISNVQATWRITNETTGKSRIINYLVNPIFCIDNNDEKRPGVYSITLNLKIGNKETTFKRHRIFRIKKDA